MEAISNMHLEPERVHKVKIVMHFIFLLICAVFANQCVLEMHRYSVSADYRPFCR